jgi:Tfp pilus assembly protein PilZ
MVAPAPDSTVRVRLKCPDADDFVERFAPNATRGGIFLPTREVREVGSTIQFELAVVGEKVVFAGRGVVTWVKPRGMGVKFTALDPASEPMLERLLGRRAAAAAAAATASAETTEAPSPTPVAAPATDTGPTSIWREASAPASPAGGTDTAATSIWSGPRRRSLRPFIAGSITLVVVAIVVVSVSAGRARVATGPSRETPKPAQAAAPVEIAAAPMTPAPARETPAPAPTVPSREARVPLPAPRPGSLRVDSVTVGAASAGSTCPPAVTRFSVRSHKTVNVCLQVTHRPDRTDHLNLVWERNGTFSGKTSVEIPASKPSVRSRTHMRISQNRLGAWSVRVVADRNVTLAQTTFEVAP